MKTINSKKELTPDEARTALPGKIKVRINENVLGVLSISPATKRVDKLIRISNEHDNSSEAVIYRGSDVQVFLEDYPDAKNDEGWIDDGAVIVMGSWEFRHMVGGQAG